MAYNPVNINLSWRSYIMRIENCDYMGKVECELIAEGPSVGVFESETEIIFAYAPLDHSIVLEKKNQNLFKKNTQTP
jgi:hypothetical protein